MSTQPPKSRVLLIGGGGVGAIAALNLEIGNLATVTLVLRSNYEAVKTKGYQIKSIDHGIVHNFKTTEILSSIPDVSASGINGPPFDYIVLVMKNLPDIGPPLTSLIAPAVTPNHTSILLLQNGLNIEKPFVAAFPTNPILSGVSLIGSVEPTHGTIVQDDLDRLIVSPFSHPSADRETVVAAAKKFVEIYGAGGKTQCVYEEDVDYQRWRKLVYNATLNPICAITGLDTGRIRLADGGVEGLVRPAMEEVVAAARAAGVVLAANVVDTMIGIDPLEIYLEPSMLADVRKVIWRSFLSS